MTEPPTQALYYVACNTSRRCASFLRLPRKIDLDGRRGLTSTTCSSDARSNERRGGRGQSVNGIRDDGGITRVDCVKDTGEVGTWVAEGEPARVKTGVGDRFSHIDSHLQLAMGEECLPSRAGPSTIDRKDETGDSWSRRRAAIVGPARPDSSAHARRSSLTTTGSSLYPCAEGKDRATEDGDSRDTPVSA
ncbi:hypothetical protein C8F01DRAFT_575515 [Mycena amicta]|nr:hypothetical protein C8F01DRAFT_575515 [Mycena amicta]